MKRYILFFVHGDEYLHLSASADISLVLSSRQIYFSCIVFSFMPVLMEMCELFGRIVIIIVKKNTTTQYVWFC